MTIWPQRRATPIGDGRTDLAGRACALTVLNCAVLLFQISLGRAKLEGLLAQFALILVRYTDHPFLLAMVRSGADDLTPFVAMMFLQGDWSVDANPSGVAFRRVQDARGITRERATTATKG